MKHIWAKVMDSRFMGHPDMQTWKKVELWVFRCAKCGAEITHDATKIQRKDWSAKFKDCDTEVARKIMEI